MSNLDLCASTGESPVDLVVLREEVLASGGAIGNDMLRRLLAHGPSAHMATVLEVIDPELVHPDVCDLPDPEVVSEHAMKVAVREGADAGRLILLQLWKRQEAWTASRSMTVSHEYATAAMDRTDRHSSRFDVTYNSDFMLKHMSPGDKGYASAHPQSKGAGEGGSMMSNDVADKVKTNLSDTQIAEAYGPAYQRGKDARDANKGAASGAARDAIKKRDNESRDLMRESDGQMVTENMSANMVKSDAIRGYSIGGRAERLYVDLEDSGDPLPPAGLAGIPMGERYPGLDRRRDFQNIQH